MLHTYGLKTARDLLKKLSRDADLLEAEVSSDRFFNFVVTAYSIVDWVKNDPSVTSSAKAEVKLFRKSKCIQICGDLANASKHFQLGSKRHPSPVVSSAESEQGFGKGRFGFGGFGVGEEEISIILSDGTEMGALQFVKDVLSAWSNFFDRHGLQSRKRVNHEEK